MSRSRSTRRAAVLLTALATSALALAPGGPAQAAGSAAKGSVLKDQYTAVGTSHIGSINADLPIAKTKLVEQLNLKTLKIVSGTLPIAPQTVSFTALGVVPVRSTTTLTQVSPITGTIRATKKGNVLKTSVSYTIKLSDVEAQFLGKWIPLGVGDNCQTASPVVISVGSPAGKYFDISKGGVVSGTYTIGQFQNCNVLDLPGGLGSFTINALVPGTNNTVSLKLSHGKFVGKS